MRNDEKNSEGQVILPLPTVHHSSEDGFSHYLEQSFGSLSSTLSDWWASIASTNAENLHSTEFPSTRRRGNFDTDTSTSNIFLDLYNDFMKSMNRHRQIMDGEWSSSLRITYKEKVLLIIRSFWAQMKHMWFAFLKSPIAPEVGRLLIMLLVAMVAYKMGQRKGANRNDDDDDDDDDETGSYSRKSVESDAEKSRSGKHKKRKRLMKLNLKRQKGGKPHHTSSTTSMEDGGSIETGDDGSSSLETGISSLRSGGVSREVSKSRQRRKGGGDGAGNSKRDPTSDIEVSRWRRVLTGSRHGTTPATKKGDKEPIGQEISVNQSQIKNSSSNQHVKELDIVIERSSDDDDDHDDNIQESNSDSRPFRKVPLNDVLSSLEEEQVKVPPTKTPETIEEFNGRVEEGCTDVHAEDNDSKEKDDDDEEIPLQPRRLLGPDVRSVKFFVSTPPREDILGLFAPMTYRSIHRLLEVNFYDLTLTLHIPKVDQDEDDTTPSTAPDPSTPQKKASEEKEKSKGKNGAKTCQEQVTGKAREEKFIRGPRIPLSAINNAHALMPLTSGVLKVSFAVPKVFARDTPMENTPDGHAKKAQVETTVTSNEKAVPLDPEYDVLEQENNFREMKRRTYIAQKSGFDVEPTILPSDKSAGIAVHGCTPSPSSNCSLDKKKYGMSEEEKGMYEDTLEFTFENAREAALFQHVVINLNSIGHPVRNLYRSLETLRIFRILNGSRGEAYQFGSDDNNDDSNNKNKAVSDSPNGEDASANGAGPPKDRLLWRELEEAMSDSRSKTALLRDPMLLFLQRKGFDTSIMREEVQGNEREGYGLKSCIWGVALDDAYRCLSSIPFLKRHLQTFYDAHYPSWRTMADFDSGLEMIDAGYYFEQSNALNSARTRQQRPILGRSLIKDKTQEISVIAAVAEAEAKREKQKKSDSSDINKDSSDKDNGDKYQERNFRNVLGMGDILYLFLGMLPLDAVPIPCPSANRSGVGHHFFNCKEELVVRRRVARASNLVQQYVSAMKVVEIGWDASLKDVSTSEGAMPTTPMSSIVWQSTRNLGGNAAMEVTTRAVLQQHQGPLPLHKRLAYDDNLANISHDGSAFNEYYEATVGRDVMRCDSVKQKMEPVQGFAMVGVNVFRTSTTSTPLGGPDGHETRERRSTTTNRTIYPTDDPVLAIPSLRELIESNPEVDFFVSSFFPELHKVCVVMVFVRSLPTHNDEVFEEALKNFRCDNSQSQSKIDIHIQLGPLPTMSPYKFSLLKGAVGIHNWNQRRKGGLEIPPLKDRGIDRFPLPPIDLEDFTEVCRFGVGGSSSTGRPSNYRSFTARLNPRMFYNPIYRLLYNQIDEQVLVESVFDLSICLRQEVASNDDSEGSNMPAPSSSSRVLGTVRVCHCRPEDIALPCPAVASPVASDTTPLIGNFPDRRRATTSGPLLTESSALNGSLNSSGLELTCSHLENGVGNDGRRNSLNEAGNLACHCRSSEGNENSTSHETRKTSSTAPVTARSLGTIQELSGGDEQEEEQESNTSNQLQLPPELREKRSFGDSTLSSVQKEQQQIDDSFVTARSSIFDGLFSSFTRDKEADRLLSDSLGSNSFTSRHSATSSDANSYEAANRDSIVQSTALTLTTEDKQKTKSRKAFESSPAFQAMQERKRREEVAKKNLSASLPTPSLNGGTAEAKTHRKVQSIDVAQTTTRMVCSTENGSFTPPRSESIRQEGQRPSNRTMRRRSRVLSKRRLYDEKDTTPMRSNTSSNSRIFTESAPFEMRALFESGVNSSLTENAPSEMRALFSSQREEYVPLPPTDSPSTVLTYPTSSTTILSGSMDGLSDIKATPQRDDARQEEIRKSSLLDAEYRAAQQSSWRNQKETNGDWQGPITKSDITNAERHAAQNTSWRNPKPMGPFYQGSQACQRNSISNLLDEEHKAARSSSWCALSPKTADALPFTSGALGTLQTEVDLTSSSRNVFSGKKMSDVGRQLRAMIEILSGINVPMRRDNPIVRRLLPHLATIRYTNEEHERNSNEDLHSTDPLSDKETLDVSVLHGVRSYDLARYLISNQLNLKMATVRFIESAAWRGLTFPIDPRTCDVELESAQFFHQGTDFDGNPVIYFRRLCRGPWREDIDASILAILYRLEQAVVTWSKLNPKIQFTMVYLDRKAFAIGSDRKRGRTFRTLSSKKGSLGGSISDGGSNSSSRKKFFQDGTESEVSSVTSAGTSRDGTIERNPPLWLGSNPRIDSTETWNSHSNHEMEARLAKILCRHYPSIFSQILVVDPYEKPQNFIRCLLREDNNMSSVVKYARGFHELKNFIDEDQLLSFAGGNAIIKISHFTAM